MNEQLEKTIRGLESLESEAYSRWVHCQYTKDELIQGIGEYVPDAVSLLRAQEAKAIKEPLVVGGNLMGKCPRCARVLSIIDYPNFCGHCGQAVKWDADD